ncbi:hypothetical protein FDP41_009500 [Naegleria fowleri]|uniref:Uncharacterized protein n=1 Tax=Naegleria fowleri TaxID=5763 RepID=A0A6A5BB27_NAEFO|nr:uncharacterized protein FDP41_009500 [Naegleria fowleri]KAF0972192.1 hypothetical protein FDP41_009500 [Naegleria fowleri]CAG4710716.1 unnamed protein product [Naegleria fowleri]
MSASSSLYTQQRPSSADSSGAISNNNGSSSNNGFLHRREVRSSSLYSQLQDSSRTRSKSSPATLINSKNNSDDVFSYNKEQHKTPMVMSDLISFMTDRNKEIDYPTQFLMNKMKKRVQEGGLSPRFTTRSQSVVMMMKNGHHESSTTHSNPGATTMNDLEVSISQKCPLGPTSR